MDSFKLALRIVILIGLGVFVGVAAAALRRNPDFLSGQFRSKSDRWALPKEVRGLLVDHKGKGVSGQKLEVHFYGPQWLDSTLFLETRPPDRILTTDSKGRFRLTWEEEVLGIGFYAQKNNGSKYYLSSYGLSSMDAGGLQLVLPETVEIDGYLFYASGEPARDCEIRIPTVVEGTTAPLSLLDENTYCWEYDEIGVLCGPGESGGLAPKTRTNTKGYFSLRTESTTRKIQVQTPEGTTFFLSIRYGFEAENWGKTYTLPHRYDTTFSVQNELGEPEAGIQVFAGVSGYLGAWDLLEPIGFTDSRGQVQGRVTHPQSCTLMMRRSPEDPWVLDDEAGHWAVTRSANSSRPPFVLPRPRNYIVRVTEGESGPVEEVRLRLWTIESFHLKNESLGLQSEWQQTGPGEFRISDLPPGYLLTLEGPSFLREALDLDEQARSAGYPSTVEIERSLRKANPLTVRILDAESGAPVAGILIAQADDCGQGLFYGVQAWTDAKGMCVLDQACWEQRMLRVHTQIGTLEYPLGDAESAVEIRLKAADFQ